MAELAAEYMNAPEVGLQYLEPEEEGENYERSRWRLQVDIEVDTEGCSVALAEFQRATD